MNSFSAVMLIITIVTSEGKPNIMHRELMPNIEICESEAHEFMRHKFPDTVDAKGLTATCAGELSKENPS